MDNPTINITGGETHIGGDMIGGDKIVNVLPPEPPRAFVAHYQMPADLDTFVGRADVLQILAGLGAVGVTPPRFLLCGIGGLGKTTLATRIAHLLKSVFNGGVLWADVPTTEPFGKLDEWARLYGGDVREFQDISARADALRAVLQTNALTRQGASPRKILAVLDGAVDESDDAKLAPLLRALADCAVLITSRATHLGSLYRARPIPLEKFNQQETEKLFQTFLPNDNRLTGNETHIHALGEAVEFLPLALELLAKQLVKHREWSLAELQNKLAETKLGALKWGIRGDGEIGIRKSFLVGYNGLHADEQTFFRRLGAFGGQDFVVEAAEFVAGKQGDRETGLENVISNGVRNLDLRDRDFSQGRLEMTTKPMSCESMLEHLLELSMAQAGTRAGRYRLHALMREFARELCGENLYAADFRMATHYYHVCKNAGDKLNGEQGENAKNIFESELSNIRASVIWAQEHPSDESSRLLRGIAYEADDYLEFRGAWAERLEWLEFGLEATRQLKDEYGIGAMLTRLGIVYQQKGEWDKAIEFYQNALTTLERVGDVHGMAQTFNNLGNVYLQKGEWDKAIEFYQKDLAISERVGDVHGMAITYMNIGNVQFQKGEWDAAIASHENSLEIRERVGDVHGMAQALSNLGSVYLQKGEWDKAIEFYQNALTTLERVGDVHGMAKIHMNLGTALRGKWKFSDSREHWVFAYEEFVKIGAPEQYQLFYLLKIPTFVLALVNVFQPILTKISHSQSFHKITAEATQIQVKGARENKP